MLFDHFESNRLVICLDPANLDLVQDFCSDKATTRLLEIECRYSDDYLLGHARRVGLASEHTPQKTLDALLPTIRNDLAHEAERIREAGFANYWLIHETASRSENTARIAEFLSIPKEQAAKVMELDHLFSD